MLEMWILVKGKFVKTVIAAVAVSDCCCASWTAAFTSGLLSQ